MHTHNLLPLFYLFSITHSCGRHPSEDKGVFGLPFPQSRTKPEFNSWTKVQPFACPRFYWSLELEKEEFLLYISSRGKNKTKESENICLGTIIASNLVLVTEGCILRGIGSPNVFDVWTAENSYNYINKLEIRVTSVPSIEDSGVFPPIEFKVADIVFSLEYSISAAYSGYPKEDVAIVVLEEDLESDSFSGYTYGRQFHPVCLSNEDVILKHYMDRVYVYDKIIGYPVVWPPRPWNKTDDCITEGSGIQPPPKRKWPNSDILKSADTATLLHCNEHSNAKKMNIFEDDDTKTLCIRTYSESVILGRPLFYVERGHPVEYPGNKNFRCGPHYLIGLSHWAAQLVNSQVFYFTNTISMTDRFIKVGRSHATRFCSEKAEADNVKNVYIPPVITSRNKRKPLKPLRCGCGVPNLGNINFDTPAPPSEYGWSVLIRIKNSSREVKCVGSLINNRMIIAPAHCFLYDFYGVVTDPPRFVRHDDVKIHSNVTTATNFICRSLHIHVKYNPAVNKRLYDIAIVVVNETINFEACGVGIRPICLPISNSLEGYKFTNVVGWRSTFTNKKEDEIDSREQYFVEKSSLKVEPSNQKIISVVLYSGNSLTSLDNTSVPLIGVDERGQWNLIGVGVAFDNIEKEGQITGQFTNIFQMLDFIRYHSNQIGVRWCHRVTTI